MSLNIRSVSTYIFYDVQNRNMRKNNWVNIHESGSYIHNKMLEQMLSRLLYHPFIMIKIIKICQYKHNLKEKI